MLRKVVTLVLIGAAVSVAACNTVRGAGERREFGRKCSRQRHLISAMVVTPTKEDRPWFVSL